MSAAFRSLPIPQLFTIHCLRCRHYEPVTGRWMQRDPIDDDGGYGVYVWRGNGVGTVDILGERPYTYEGDLFGGASCRSLYFRVVTERKDCPYEMSVEVMIGAEWQPPQLRIAQKLLTPLHVHVEAGFSGIVGGKIKWSECFNDVEWKICGRLEPFSRIEYRVSNFRKHSGGRFARFRFGGGDVVVNLGYNSRTGAVTVSASHDRYYYANLFFGGWRNRACNYCWSGEVGDYMVFPLGPISQDTLKSKGLYCGGNFK